MNSEVRNQNIDIENHSIEPVVADSSSRSSSSSFVPIHQPIIQDAIQLINEEKIFNNAVLEYITKSSNENSGNSYHIISVFGSQSTGKSTLLNKLFYTNFDVMDAQKRQQTTKGIWFAHAPSIATYSRPKSDGQNIFVMDVEGTDGRERGEDQDFERKAALFAMATSEVLIINIWEHQVGLYQGANLGLLKTVFEVNLSLFGESKLENNDHKILLLIVIRDHLGTTPKKNLAHSILEDLHNMWHNLNKPVNLEHLKFDDFFDVDFHTMRHKVLQPEFFVEDVKLLGDRFSSPGNLFKSNYHHNIPIDGWTLYAENCWNQIDNNKDLDLPTQQILVAKFKCDEISNSLLSSFEERFEPLFDEASHGTNGINFEHLAMHLSNLRGQLLHEFDISASKYIKSVYEQKRAGLSDTLNERLKSLIDLHTKNVVANIKKEFSESIRTLSGRGFHEDSKKLLSKAAFEFEAFVAIMSLGGLFSYATEANSLNKELSMLVDEQSISELQKIVNKALKKLKAGLTKKLRQELAYINPNIWDKVLGEFNSLSDSNFHRYKLDDGYDFGLNTPRDVNMQKVTYFEFMSWVTFNDVLRSFISQDRAISILRERFEDKFRYDENGIPKMYDNQFQLDQAFEESKEFATGALPLLSHARLSDDSEILPPYDIFDKDARARITGKTEETDDEDDDDSEEEQSFAIILTEQTRSHVLSSFKKEISARYIENKRSLMQHATHIPTYIYVLLVLLGWNEFMAVVRNPFFFTLLIMIGAGFYVLYSMNLLKPAILVAQKMFDESLALGKEKLRELIAEDNELHSRNLAKMSDSRQEFDSVPFDEEKKDGGVL